MPKGSTNIEPTPHVLAYGQDVLLRLDVKRAATMRKLLGQDGVFIFMIAESEMALVKQLVERKTESLGNVICNCNFVKCTIKYTHTPVH
jgi:guanylate kinase